jgi:hypothetical protein
MSEVLGADAAAGAYRVGEVATVLGVPASTIRSWEARYGVATQRTSGGHRRYTEIDVEQLRSLRDLITRGRTRTTAMAGGDVEIVLGAMRSIIRAQRVRDVVEVLTAVVRVIGGDVVAVGDATSDTLPLDLSLGEGDPMLPTAPTFSVVRLRLEQVLPDLVEDARAVAALLRAAEAI